MSRTLCVEGDVTAADTATLLTTQGSVTTPSRQIPAGVRMIKNLAVTFATDAAAAAAGILFVRLTGPAVSSGAQSIVVGGVANIAVQTGGDGSQSDPVMFRLDNVDIPVSAGDTLNVEVESAGGDTGTVNVVVGVTYA